MGEAKKRGTPEERAQQAKERIEALKPERVACGQCGAEVGHLLPIDVRQFPGVAAGFAGICTACDETTTVMLGEPDACRQALQAISEATGEDMIVGEQSGRNPGACH